MTTTTTTTTKPETKKQIKERERKEAIERLREMFPPGSTVYCVLRHVSRSGMRREISFFAHGADGIVDVDWLVCRALDMRLGDRGVKVDGCGMDMGFAVVYNLSSVMYREGFECTGEGKYASANGEGSRPWCPSNDHSNGDRDYTRHWHKSGGYALRHRWI